MLQITSLPPPNRIVLAILLTSTAYFLFSLHDAAIKLLVTGFTVWQVMFIRSLTILAGFLFAGRLDVFRDAARSPLIRPIAFRAVILLVAWVSYYSAAASLQLAELTTIYFAAPVIVTVLAIPLLGERVAPAQWASVLIGFLGVFIACNPVQLGLSIPVMLVLLAAGLWALSIVLVRKIALSTRTEIQMVLTNLFFLLMMAGPMIWTWQTPDFGQLALLVGVGVLAGFGQFTLFEGMRHAPASVVAPFEYTGLIWAFALGYLIWQDVPRPEVLWGAVLIVAAGAMVLLSETRRR